jgi:hypothetical protein
MAIQAFNLSLEPYMCRLHVDDDPDVAHIPRRLISYRHKNSILGFSSS